jgi:phenylpyruvate tautomerase PptA (4-oxalocrotonate tautomerase family)
MPHIVIKAFKGSTKEQMIKAGEEAVNAVSLALNKPKRFFSVSFEEYTPDEWEGVYNDYIEGKDNVVYKPAYTNPKTFE